MPFQDDSTVLHPSLDLERSEFRYIFYSHDQQALVEDFLSLGFKKKIYTESPITQTIYFGSRKGLQPGLSIKGRIYTQNRVDNIWEITPSTFFNILEIKSTLSQGEAFIIGALSEEGLEYPFMADSITKELSTDLVFRIQKASEDGLLRDSTLKSKSRLKKMDLGIDQRQNNLTLEELVVLLTKPSELDEKLSDKTKKILNNKVRPLYFKSLIPYVMTQYSRIHLIPEKDRWRDIIRVTIDPGVDYYDLLIDESNFLDDPKGIAELIHRENFCRLEFKLDPSGFKDDPYLEKTISDIIREYRCIAYLSKKWTGVTLVSERHIQKQALWREALYKEIAGFFPVDPSWFSYGSVTEGLLQIINRSQSFETFENHPRVLVKNENFVHGFLGLPSPSLVITIEGPKIHYKLPSTSYPVKLIRGQSEFYITEEYVSPVRSTVISSKNQLSEFLHPSIEIEGYSFFRSYGFLVMATNSNRVYKLTIERMTRLEGDDQKTEIYCKMRYIGSFGRLYKINEQKVYDELISFYEEFSPIMTKPLSLDASN
ncbi:MAG: hypothetical protein GF308_18705 [Candidatus Heimdallarchaeota archaeon]|nr:hypothetical protein [Candidatus Heimdallarchaeota archaeon]